MQFQNRIVLRFANLPKMEDVRFPGISSIANAPMCWHKNRFPRVAQCDVTTVTSTTHKGATRTARREVALGPSARLCISPDRFAPSIRGVDGGIAIDVVDPL
jgi:hypothetical protein